jgi:hypothetical protein
MDITTESPVIRGILGKTQINFETGCWIWTGSVNRAKSKKGLPTKNAYPGDVWLTSRHRKRAHRLMCLAYNGPIPDGYEVDHLCRVTLCVNPDHLEAVTPAENMRRRFVLITHCPEGHEYTPENTILQIIRSGRGNLTRHCRECERARHRTPDARAAERGRYATRTPEQKAERNAKDRARRKTKS